MTTMTLEQIEAKAAYQRKYDAVPEHIEANRKRNATPEAKATRHEYSLTPESRAAKRKYNDSPAAKTRLKVRLAEHKKLAQAYLGNACASCGTTGDLEFDHIEPSTKSYDIGRRYNSAWKTLKKELDLTQLLCVSCHRTKTNAERRAS